MMIVAAMSTVQCYAIIHSIFLSFILPIDFASAAESAAEPSLLLFGVVCIWSSSRYWVVLGAAFLNLTLQHRYLLAVCTLRTLNA